MYMAEYLERKRRIEQLGVQVLGATGRSIKLRSTGRCMSPYTTGQRGAK